MKRHASMNRAYRLVWSQVRNVWVAVAENAKGAGKGGRSSSLLLPKAIVAALSLAFAPFALANPIGGTVSSGQATFATKGNTLTVTNTPGTIINWQGFSIGANETTNFAQQSAASTVLNRVTSANPSSILGSLQSNGRVFLVNPNGIVFGAGSTINVGGLVATTLNLSDADFLAGKNNFTGGTAATGNVSNAGNITAQNGGQIYLIAPNVDNSGVINAPNGEIILAAGNSVVLVNSLAPSLGVSITSPAGNATNVGQLVASAGNLGLFGALVNNSGAIRADSATMQGGEIVLKASQNASVGGAVSATGTTGGTIEVQGSAVHITSGALLDASGANGGGTVLVGGGAHGADSSVMNAQTTTVDAGSTIKADARQNGNGGKVTVWSDVATQAHGSISAQGGVGGGNGGFIETSGHSLDVNGIQITAAAPHGLTGTWLLDPVDFTIAASGGDITGALLSTELGSANVTILSSSGAVGGTAGNINVNDVVNWSANKLTLNAWNNININANLNGSGTAILELIYGQEAGVAYNAALINTGVVNLNKTAAGIFAQINLPAGPNFSTVSGQISAGPTGSITTNYTVINSLGAAGSLTGLDLQGINGNLSANYMLGSNIDASATSGWNSGAGFTPIGNSIAQFTGTFWGAGHVISNLYINQPTTAGSYIGLFGYINSPTAVVRDVGLVGESITGYFYVGGLVGYNFGGTISGSYTTGSVTGINLAGSGYIGGLVGYNGNSSATSTNSTVTDSFSTATVTATSGISVVGQSGYGDSVGGLIGYADYGSFINNSYATGNVSGLTNVGGLVGSAKGNISNNYAKGNVSGSTDIGGLIGWNGSGAASSALINNYALGSVSGSLDVGGLLGLNDSLGTITNNFATGAVAGTTDTGGLVGLNKGSINFAYSTGNVTGTGTADTGSLVGVNQPQAYATNVYATGSVNGAGVRLGTLGSSFSYTGGNLFGADTSGTMTATSNLYAGFPTLTPDNWTGTAGDGLWTSPANWSGSNGIPTIFNTATFAGTTPITVSIPSNVLVGKIDTSGATSTTINFTEATVSSLTIGNNAAVTLNSTINYGTSGKLNFTAATSLIYNGTATGAVSIYAPVGSITFDASVASSSSITLLAGSTITEGAGGSLNTTGLLTTSSVGGTTLSGANNVFGYTSSNSGTGDISFTNNAAFTASGITNTAAVGGISLTDSAANTGITNLGAILTSNGAITLKADSMTLAGSTITAGSSNVTLASYSPTQAISIGTGGSGLVFSTTDLATISTTGTLGFSSGTGGITVNTPLNAPTGGLSLTSTGTITETGSNTITANSLTTSSVGGTTLTNNNGILSYNATNSGGGNITTYSNTGLLTVTGISQSGGAVGIANTGALTLAGGVISTGDIYLTVTAAGVISEAAGGYISTPGFLRTSSVGGTALDGANTVGSFKGLNAVSGDIKLTNTYSLFTIKAPTGPAISNPGGNVYIYNTGGVVVAGSASSSGSFDLTAIGPITINSGASINAGGSVVLIAGSAGSTSVLDSITINGFISGSSVTLDAAHVTGNIPVSATIQVNDAFTPLPTVLDTLASVVATLPTSLTDSDDSSGKKDVMTTLASNKSATNSPISKSLPVCN